MIHSFVHREVIQRFKSFNSTKNNRSNFSIFALEFFLGFFIYFTHCCECNFHVFTREARIAHGFSTWKKWKKKLEAWGREASRREACEVSWLHKIATNILEKLRRNRLQSVHPAQKDFHGWHGNQGYSVFRIFCPFLCAPRYSFGYRVMLYAKITTLLHLSCEFSLLKWIKNLDL